MSPTDTVRDWPPLREGSHGLDVLRLQQLLAGGNRYNVDFHPGPCDGVFGPQTGDAVQRAKWYLGYAAARISRGAGEELRGFMVDMHYPQARRRPPTYIARGRARRGHPYPGVTHGRPYPFATRHTIIQRPYGTGTHSSPRNWESCNAVDLVAPVGTRLLAVVDGTIGTSWGPLPSSDPRMAGLRLHLIGTPEWYYAHCSKLIARPLQHVKRGEVIALSGQANGVAHLHLACSVGDPGAFIGDPSPGYTDHHYPA